jgi:hypothetical protein
MVCKPIPSEIEVRPVASDEFELWARTVAAGFQEVDSSIDAPELPVRSLDLFYCLGFAEGARPFLVHLNGEAVGGGVLFVDGDTAYLRTTSCRFVHRRNGVQTALLSARLQQAQQAGCSIAISSTDGASTSARNLERFGLQPLSVSYMMSKDA